MSASADVALGRPDGRDHGLDRCVEHSEAIGAIEVIFKRLAEHGSARRCGWWLRRDGTPVTTSVFPGREVQSGWSRGSSRTDSARCLTSAYAGSDK